MGIIVEQGIREYSRAGDIYSGYSSFGNKIYLLVIGSGTSHYEVINMEVGSVYKVISENKTDGKKLHKSLKSKGFKRVDVVIREVSLRMEEL